MRCIDLKEKYGHLYRLGKDPAAEGRSDPWAHTLLCQRGTVYPYGGTTLAVEIDGRPGIARRVAALPGVIVHQRGDRDQEVTLLFDVSDFDAVAAIIRPRKRRKLSQEQREAGAARLASWKAKQNEALAAQEAIGEAG